MWDEKRANMVSQEACSNFLTGSGKLPNPGKGVSRAGGTGS